jgi:hypothetical protein
MLASQPDIADIPEEPEEEATDAAVPEAPQQTEAGGEEGDTLHATVDKGVDTAVELFKSLF